MFIKFLGVIYFALIVVSFFSTTASLIAVLKDKQNDILKGTSLFEKIINVLMVIILIPFIPIIATIEYCKDIL